MNKKLNLILHCGGQEVDFEDVQNVETPDPTDTWHPIPHSHLVETVIDGLKNVGLSVINSAHGLWQGGLRHFGLFQVQPEDYSDEYSLVVGMRNSHDKSFPAALALGSGVFVCDNLAFSGEIKLARRHTKNILRDLPGVVSTAIGRLADLRNAQEKRIDAYQNTAMNDFQAHDFIVRALDAKVIGSQRIPSVLEHWRNPQHEEFKPRTAWSMFNAFTEAFKPKKRQGDRDNNNLLVLPAATTKLHGIMDQQCGLNFNFQRDETLG